MNRNYSIKNTIRLHVDRDKSGEQVFKSLFTHPMETGYRRDSRTGEKVPADYIENVLITVDGEKYFEITLGENVSKNPFLSFAFTKPLVDNQLMTVSWVDNNKKQTSYDCVIKFEQDGIFRFRGNDKGTKVYRLLPKAKPVCKTKPTTT